MVKECEVCGELCSDKDKMVYETVYGTELSETTKTDTLYFCSKVHEIIFELGIHLIIYDMEGAVNHLIAVHKYSLKNVESAVNEYLRRDGIENK